MIIIVLCIIELVIQAVIAVSLIAINVQMYVRRKKEDVTVVGVVGTDLLFNDAELDVDLDPTDLDTIKEEDNVKGC